VSATAGEYPGCGWEEGKTVPGLVVSEHASSEDVRLGGLSLFSPAEARRRGADLPNECPDRVRVVEFY
jgi:hypothetical protein